MNKLLILALLIGMISGCSEKNNYNKIQEGSNELPYDIYELNYEGHNYLYYSYGGIIHSESCKCKRGNK